jgi:MFS family permease
VSYRIGPRWPAIVGLVLTGFGTLLLTYLTEATPRPLLIAWLIVRAVGIGLAFIPVMTGGLSALAADVADVGSAFNIMTQRVAASLGLALLTALAAEQQAQLTADRGSLLARGGAHVDPGTQLGGGALRMMQQATQQDLQAQAYSTVFLVAGVLAFVALPLTALLPTGRPNRASESELETAR